MKYNASGIIDAFLVIQNRIRNNKKNYQKGIRIKTRRKRDLVNSDLLFFAKQIKIEPYLVCKLKLINMYGVVE